MSCNEADCSAITSGFSGTFGCELGDESSEVSVEHDATFNLWRQRLLLMDARALSWLSHDAISPPLICPVRWSRIPICISTAPKLHHGGQEEEVCPLGA